MLAVALGNDSYARMPSHRSYSSEDSFARRFSPLAPLACLSPVHCGTFACKSPLLLRRQGVLKARGQWDYGESGVVKTRAAKPSLRCECHLHFHGPCSGSCGLTRLGRPTLPLHVLLFVRRHSPRPDRTVLAFVCSRVRM
jgi:hypothetical protein